MKCTFCKTRTVSLLCDYILGFQCEGWSGCSGETALKVGRFHEFVPGKGLPCTGMDSPMFTCDAPICSDCAKHVGTEFICGEKDSFSMTIDYCPIHANQERKLRVMSADDAESIRLRDWKRQLKLCRTGT